jgi:predicted ATP-grasp superfamily ATP-dependent carboligase
MALAMFLLAFPGIALVGGVAAHWLANSLTRAERSPAEGNAR